MRIFVYEHICATRAPELAALRAEGEAMLRAVTADFARLDGVEPITLAGQFAGLSRTTIEQAVAAEAARADHTLLIAPETDGILLALCRAVQRGGGRLLGPSATAVELAGDKLALCKHWQDNGVRTPACRLLLSRESSGIIFGRAVVKPRHGAGSQATFLVKNPEQLTAALGQAQAEGNCDELLAQSFIPGRPASVAWLVGPRQQLPLLPTAQHLSDNGRFHYQGGVLPLSRELAFRAVRLSQQAVECVPGLRGYVGVDLVLGAAGDGSQDFAIELNPRLTTSYIGLRQLTRINLALAMLRVATGEPVELSWDGRPLRFFADGRTTPAV